MATTRSTIVSHPQVANIQYHVTAHQKYRSEDGKLVPDGDPFPVIELFRRNEKGELELITRSHLAPFTELSRDVVKTGRELLPKDEDEVSDGEAVS